ncbi:hypothetical protein [Demequina litorisediminis]|nr:hypothetical protein [Demequina litorisediminis]
MATLPRGRRLTAVAATTASAVALTAALTGAAPARLDHGIRPIMA